MKKRYKIVSLLLILSAFALSCCNEDEDVIPDPAGKIKFSFENYVDGNPLVLDTLMYVNEAGNSYLVQEVQYFVSNITLYKSDGTIKIIDDWTDFRYIDSNIPSTMEYLVYDSIKPGDYDSLSFTFGFKNADNESFMFVNPPERDMMWPEYLGGGYHYMKINGKWKTTDNLLRGFAFHLGIGQIYDVNNEVIGFIDNSFRVSVPNSSFTITDGQTTNLRLRMNIEEWFKNPEIYDHNVHGGDIMQNQNAMSMAARNGWNVFSLHQ